MAIFQWTIGGMKSSGKFLGNMVKLLENLVGLPPNQVIQGKSCTSMLNQGKKKDSSKNQGKSR